MNSKERHDSSGGRRHEKHEPGWKETRPIVGPLETIDKLLGSIANSSLRSDLLHLRNQVEGEELTIQEARAAIEKMDEVIKKVTSPANRVGVFLGILQSNTALIWVNGTEYRTNVDPRMNLPALKIGTRVLLNEAYVIIGELGYDNRGQLGKFSS